MPIYPSAFHGNYRKITTIILYVEICFIHKKSGDRQILGLLIGWGYPSTQKQIWRTRNELRQHFRLTEAEKRGTLC